MDNTAQYRATLVADGEIAFDLEIDEPFVTLETSISGWRAALKVLLGRYDMEFKISGSQAAERVVRSGEYLP